MVLCLLALPVFALLSIFSIRYRKLTLDALNCLFRTVTLRKCESGLDDRIKASLTGKVLKFSPRAASFFYNHYQVFSWILLIIFAWSLYASTLGIYNYINYGNCNGPESNGFCIFDPLGEQSGCSDVDVIAPEVTTLPVLEDNDPIIGNKDAELTVIEFGCYACSYTKKAEPVMREVLDYYDGKVNIQFKTFNIPGHALSYETALAADCAHEQGAYPKYHQFLLGWEGEMTHDLLIRAAEKINIDVGKFETCLQEEKYKDEINVDTLMGVNAGVHATPTFFINKQKIIGLKPFKTFKIIIDEELEKAEAKDIKLEIK